MANRKPVKTLRPLPAWTDPAIALARSRWAALCGVLLGLGLLLMLCSLLSWLQPRGLAAYVGCFLALYGAVVALQRMPPHWLGAWSRRRLRQTLVRSGLGFYGLMTVARFLQLEAHALVDSLGSLESARSLIGSLAFEWLIGFSMESLKNSIEAFMWPVWMMQRQGMALGGAVVVSLWSLYALGARVFPDVHAELESGEDPTAADAAGQRASDAS